ncbi:MAG: tetratricopeptide repeat protein [Candidatus Magnetoovum sp. WYHC-5]|nr:tetratricopeptide repeat protein [Candidatus Magnetoovum sp. WYHC-5]
MIKVVNVFFIVFFLCTIAYANEDLFAKGNVYYSEGKYDEAIKAYTGAIDEGYESANVYYNIGNCYFKIGKIGMAILFYERARQIEPRNKDLLYNEAYARTFIKPMDDSTGAFIKIKHMINAPFSVLTINGLTIALCMFYLLIILTLIGRLYSAAIRKYSVVIVSVAVVFLVFGAYALYGQATLLGKKAVVVEQKAEVLFGPFEKATIFYTLPEGATVKVLEKQDKWYKVERPDGKAGWVTKGVVEII